MKYKVLITYVNINIFNLILFQKIKCNYEILQN